MGIESDLKAVVQLERTIAEGPHWNADVYGRILVGGGIDGERRLLVAVAVEDDAAVLGFAVGRVMVAKGEGDGEIESVAVSAAYRRRGLGHDLCRGLLRWFGEAGVSRAELEVRSSSAGAQAMYDGLGFREVGRRLGYYGEPVEDAVLMRVELQSRNVR